MLLKAEVVGRRSGSARPRAESGLGQQERRVRAQSLTEMFWRGLGQPDDLTEVIFLTQRSRTGAVVRRAAT